MRLNKIHSLFFLSILFVLPACNQKSTQPDDVDPLPSWNEGKTKQSIINFVNTVTDESNPNFVLAEERIATFDNDGCLWSEKPFYFQLVFAMDRVKELAAEHPEWKETQPFKAVLENDMDALLESGEHGLLDHRRGFAADRYLARPGESRPAPLAGLREGFAVDLHLRLAETAQHGGRQDAFDKDVLVQNHLLARR